MERAVGGGVDGGLSRRPFAWCWLSGPLTPCRCFHGGVGALWGLPLRCVAVGAPSAL